MGGKHEPGQAERHPFPALAGDWWRDPPSLTDADKARLNKLGDREASALDGASDEHEHVWGFRQDRPHERRRLELREIGADKDEWHGKLAAAGHAMTWELDDRGPGFAPAWYGTCRNDGASMSIFDGGTSIGASAWCARDMPCKGPGAAWQEEMVRDLRNKRVGEAVGEFGQAVKDRHDRAWLASRGLEVRDGHPPDVEMEAG